MTRRVRRVRRSLLVIGAPILGTAVALAVPSPTQAEPDLYTPNWASGWCPGGKAQFTGSPIGHGYCDGMHYPDGSYWQQVERDLPSLPVMRCVIKPDSDGPVPRPAPPGGCGGAV